jgi:hypothetical protein
VLGEQFPLVSYLAGEALFHDLVTDFVLARPSIDPDVRRLGERFPDYVARHAIHGKLPCLPDVARVEWAMVAALDGPDDPVLTVEALRTVPVPEWPELRFELTRTTHLLSSRWDVAGLWTARRDVGPADAPTATAPAEHALVVYRRNLDVFHRRLAPGEATALGALARGETFETACAIALQREVGALTASDLARWLTAWTESSLICRMIR